jgi:ABC-2 type transport system permease protein
MFKHIFVNRLKCLVRDKQLLFWTFVFPLLLASMYGMAFTNIGSEDNFKSIPIAVVDNAEYQSNAAFQNALDSVSDANPKAASQLFHSTVETKQQADNDLKNSNITGYILFDNGAHVVVKESGINQSILKEFMDSYLQTSSAYTSIAMANPQAAQNFQQTETQSYLAEVASGKAPQNPYMISFYGLIGMAAMFGGFWGKKQISDNQADLSPQGARINLAPVHKLKTLGYSFIAAILIQFLSLLVLVAFLIFAIKIDFGDQVGYVVLTCLAGSTVGVSFGALIGSVTNKGDHFKTTLLIAVGMLCSFLSGMMVMSVKFDVTHAAPIMAYINPANVLSDAFYALYYYSTYNRFFLELGILFGLSAVFFLIVYLITRRQRYASI